MVTTAATVVLALLTGIYVWLTHKLLRAQSEPHVVLYARSDELRPGLIELVMHNVGKTVARDVRFKFSREMFRAYGVTEDGAKPPEPLVDGPLVTGIPALGPGDMRRITWGQFGGLKKELGDGTISVTTHFKGSGKKDLPPVISELDVASFAQTDISERDPALRLVGEVRKLTRAVESIQRTLNDATENPTLSSGGDE